MCVLCSASPHPFPFTVSFTNWHVFPPFFSFPFFDPCLHDFYALFCLWRVAAQCINITFPSPSPTPSHYPPLCTSICVGSSPSWIPRGGRLTVYYNICSHIVSSPFPSDPSPLLFLNTLPTLWHSGFRGSVYVVGFAGECSFHWDRKVRTNGCDVASHVSILAPHTQPSPSPLISLPVLAVAGPVVAHPRDDGSCTYVRRLPVLRSTRLRLRLPGVLPTLSLPDARCLICPFCLIYRQLRNVKCVQVICAPSPFDPPQPPVSSIPSLRPLPLSVVCPWVPLFAHSSLSLCAQL
ncbi:hypothetical protein C8Q78DRAFT_9914 [Trametes maxima]|nr:hypothetical protein C8Q78DRAFT_9914 [Trametes maxima]